jgi:hypothetical protein
MLVWAGIASQREKPERRIFALNAALRAAGGAGSLALNITS